MTNELNPMELKTSSAYLEYILQSEGEILWMHFEEARKLEFIGKDEAFDEGFEEGFNAAINLVQISVARVHREFKEEQDV